MFRCQKCRELIGPNKAPIYTPTGFRKGDGITPKGQRLGEVMLCSNCHKGFERDEAITAEVVGGYRFTYLNGAGR